MPQGSKISYIVVSDKKGVDNERIQSRHFC